MSQARKFHSHEASANSDDCSDTFYKRPKDGWPIKLIGKWHHLSRLWLRQLRSVHPYHHSTCGHHDTELCLLRNSRSALGRSNRHPNQNTRHLEQSHTYFRWREWVKWVPIKNFYWLIIAGCTVQLFFIWRIWTFSMAIVGIRRRRLVKLLCILLIIVRKSFYESPNDKSNVS